jgi:hypothetical protein
MNERAWLHMSGPAGTWLAYPVEVLSRGAKFARVRLLHQTRIGRTKHLRGTIKHRVPLDSLAAEPQRFHLVSCGGGRFVEGRRWAS